MARRVAVVNMSQKVMTTMTNAAFQAARGAVARRGDRPRRRCAAPAASRPPGRRGRPRRGPGRRAPCWPTPGRPATRAIFDWPIRPAQGRAPARSGRPYSSRSSPRRDVRSERGRGRRRETLSSDHVPSEHRAAMSAMTWPATPDRAGPRPCPGRIPPSDPRPPAARRAGQGASSLARRRGLPRLPGGRAAGPAQRRRDDPSDTRAILPPWRGVRHRRHHLLRHVRDGHPGAIHRPLRQHVGRVDWSNVGFLILLLVVPAAVLGMPIGHLTDRWPKCRVVQGALVSTAWGCGPCRWRQPSAAPGRERWSRWASCSGFRLARPHRGPGPGRSCGKTMGLMATAQGVGRLSGPCDRWGALGPHPRARPLLVAAALLTPSSSSL